MPPVMIRSPSDPMPMDRPLLTGLTAGLAVVAAAAGGYLVHSAVSPRPAVSIQAAAPATSGPGAPPAPLGGRGAAVAPRRGQRGDHPALADAAARPAPAGRRRSLLPGFFQAVVLQRRAGP